MNSTELIYAHFDRSAFPVILVTFSGAQETDENFAAYLDELLANYDKMQAFSLVFDASNAPNPNLKYQLRQATWMKEHESLIKTYCKGVAYVMPNNFLRIVLKAIFKIQRNPVPFSVFKELDQGRIWAEAFH